jgi:hypothetical protein
VLAVMSVGSQNLEADVHAASANVDRDHATHPDMFRLRVLFRAQATKYGTQAPQCCHDMFSWCPHDMFHDMFVH